MFKANNPFILAPLAGITDAIMREICSSMGASLTYTEMVSAKGIYYDDIKTDRLLYIPKDAGMTSIQIFGSDPYIMGEAARKIDKRNNDYLDINMGCPAPKIVKNGDGCALMKNPELIYKIIKSVKNNTDKPVTIKIRKGLNEDSINAIEVAKVAEEAGVAAIAIHGRTREEYYSGEADWEIIKEIKKACKIPIIGNGDIFTPIDAELMLKMTGCDYVMIGRASLGNPWIFKELNAYHFNEEFSPPSFDEKIQIILKHFDGLMDLKGEYIAVREMRKHIAWYVKGMKNAAKIRNEINKIDDASEMRKIINAGFRTI